jgi:EAL domain-containing protein (putative c-di-GMP-specific phosphodiesterase class I)
VSGRKAIPGAGIRLLRDRLALVGVILIAGLAHFALQARIALIAEGIETPAELAVLKSLGVEFG